MQLHVFLLDFIVDERVIVGNITVHFMLYY